MAASVKINDYEMDFLQFSNQESVVTMYYAHWIFILKFEGKKRRAMHGKIRYMLVTGQ